jgi:hypothetical protein
MIYKHNVVCVSPLKGTPCHLQSEYCSSRFYDPARRSWAVMCVTDCGHSVCHALGRY